MPLKPNMTLQEAEEFLKGDLKQSIKNDIHPILQLDKEEGGYFGVPRSVLCYVDFLATLYVGRGGEAVHFLKDVMASVDPLYAVNGELLYRMYRHGTVHRYQPNELKQQQTGKTLSWLPYKGDREAWTIADRRALKLRHMQPIKGNDQSDWLPVSINCLYDDLRATIDEFCARLDADTTLLTKWNKAAVALCKPAHVSRSWSTS
jgi:hypothetical protein